MFCLAGCQHPTFVILLKFNVDNIVEKLSSFCRMSIFVRDERWVSTKTTRRKTIKKEGDNTISFKGCNILKETIYPSKQAKRDKPCLIGRQRQIVIESQYCCFLFVLKTTETCQLCPVYTIVTFITFIFCLWNIKSMLNVWMY